MSDNEKVKAATLAALAMGETIRELGRVPSGHLYAAVMSKMSLQCYQQLIGVLKNAGLVREESHELIWCGPRQ